MSERFCRVVHLTDAQRSALRKAVYDASGWRGSLTGCVPGDMESERDEIIRLTQHDQVISDACEALKALGIRPMPGTEADDSYAVKPKKRKS